MPATPPGIPAPDVRSTQAAGHIDQLLAAGWTSKRIAEAAGVCHTAVINLNLRRVTAVKIGTWRAILAVDAAAHTSRCALVPAIGPRRRVQALAALGHPLAHTAAEAGISRDHIHYIAHGRAVRVKAPTADAIDSVFRRNSMTVGPNRGTATRAAKHGWAPPLAWDDIDDPAEAPKLGARALRTVAVAEDAAELEAWGFTRRQAAERLGVSRTTLEKSISRAAGMGRVAA